MKTAELEEDAIDVLKAISVDMRRLRILKEIEVLISEESKKEYSRKLQLEG